MELKDRVVALEMAFAAERSRFVGIDELDTIWVLVMAFLVFFMQVGFAMLEVGSVSSKNSKAVLFKNLGDATLGAISWWLIGYGLANGEDRGGVIGVSGFAMESSVSLRMAKNLGLRLGGWVFSWSFAATAATIVSGAVAERVRIVSYLLYSQVITAFIYPMVAHSVWNINGWASPYRCSDVQTYQDYADCRERTHPLLLGCGAADFAGAGVVHMVGGLCALVATIVIKARSGRFRGDGAVNKMPNQSPALQTLGTLILWVSWYGFNAGSSGTVSQGRSGVAAKAMAMSTICPAASVLTQVAIAMNIHKKFSSTQVNNGILAGLVAITASGPLVDAEGAFIIGVVASIILFLGSEALLRFRIDDVVDATPVHFMCGVWGLISSALFSTKANYTATYNNGIFFDEDRQGRCCGVFYGCGGRLLGANVLTILAVCAWTCIMSFSSIMLIKHTLGLRVPLHVEEMGMDRSKHTRRKSTALRRALAHLNEQKVSF